MTTQFWDSVPGRFIAGRLAAVLLFATIVLLGGAQNGLLWDHVFPEDFNDWGNVGLAGVAGGYGFYLGLTGRISP